MTMASSATTAARRATISFRNPPRKWINAMLSRNSRESIVVSAIVVFSYRRMISDVLRRALCERDKNFTQQNRGS
jgi:hypothetical protein